MNRLRIIGLIGGAILIVVAILIGMGFDLAPPAAGAGNANSGKGGIGLYQDKPANLDAASGKDLNGFGEYGTCQRESDL